jgi:pimeloyl-ACP methyl ester carboxylesterase
MSNTGSRWSGQPSPRIYPTFFSRGARDRDAFIAHAERLFAAIGSRGIERDVEGIRRIAGLSYDRDPTSDGSERQLAAIQASGDRTRDLRRVSTPTLVIHGSVDPLISPSGGRATARAIPGARLMMINGMGHDLPRVLWPQLIDAIAGHAASADALAGRAAGDRPPGEPVQTVTG